MPDKRKNEAPCTIDEPSSSRRQFLSQLATLSASFTVAPLARGAVDQPAEVASVPEKSTEIDVVLNVNGQDQKLRIDPRVTLLDALRERLHMTGTKKGCDHGACGACTLLVDGRRVVSCLTLAVMAQNKKVTTIEGLAQGNALHPVQEAFIQCDGFQCGYCTPGQIMSAVGCIAEGKTRNDREIREFMSGNLCRCGAYPNIVDAVKMAAQPKKGLS